MSTVKKKNFHLWFSKLRCFPAAVKPSSQPHTPNKKSLSLENSDYYSSTSTAADDCFFSDDSTSDSDAAVPDFSAAVASHRFFFSSPGCSNSIFDSSPDHHQAAVDGGVKVRKVSPNPFVDFRASMQEMVEAKDRPVDVRRDWQYLQELLVCYLQINPVDTHKFILSAFSDLVVYLLESSPESPSDHRPRRRNIDSHSCDPKIKKIHTHWKIKEVLHRDHDQYAGESLVVGERLECLLQEDKRKCGFR